jgi:predicted PurR-regulated permease PerM
MNVFKAISRGLLFVVLVFLAIAAIAKWGPIGVFVALAIFVVAVVVERSIGPADDDEPIVTDWHEA